MSGSQPPITPARSYQPSFSAGELTPPLRWREDLARGRAGAAQVLNFIVLPQGGVARRAGTQHIGVGKDPTARQRLIPFQFSTSQQYAIETGDMYMRFIQNGSYVMNGANVYEISTPYAIADVPALRFVQSADVITIVHPSYPPAELRRYGDTNWQLVPQTIGPQISAPSGLTATAVGQGSVPGTPAPATLGYDYAVTASSISMHTESTISGSAHCDNQDLGYYKQYNVHNDLAWNAVAGADFYTVYRNYQGVWGRIGSTVGTTFADINYIPDTTSTPPQFTNPFANGNNPGTVGYFQERLVFGGSNQQPETMWMSRSGNYSNFDVSTPVQDDDAITYTLAARQVNQIRHIIALTDLMIFTGGGGWRLSGANGPVTPANLDVAPQTFVGASDVDPIVVGNRILFVEAKGSSVREIAFQFVQNQYVSEDRSIFAKHLFIGHSIVSWAYAESPDKALWAIRDDGVLLSLTYLIEQDIYAWTQHTTNGLFRSVIVISENNIYGQPEDVAYFVVLRTYSDGSTASMIERMQTRLLSPANNDPAEAWHVDSGLQYRGAAVSTVAGLLHLANQTVTYLADGVPGTGVVTNDGHLTLPFAATRITVGLGFTSSVTLLPVESPSPQVEPLLGRLKRLYRARVPVENAASLWLSVDGGDPVQLNIPDDGSTATAPDNGMLTGILEGRPVEGWTRAGQITISTSTPLPATVLGCAGEWEVGE